MKYEQPMMEITKMNNTDVIMTSGELTNKDVGKDSGVGFEDTGW